jgi:hypothetical protein
MDMRPWIGLTFALGLTMIVLGGGALRLLGVVLIEALILGAIVLRLSVVDPPSPRPPGDPPDGTGDREPRHPSPLVDAGAEATRTE